MSSRKLGAIVTNVSSRIIYVKEVDRTVCLDGARHLAPRRNAIYLLIISNPSKADVHLVHLASLPFYLTVTRPTCSCDSPRTADFGCLIVPRAVVYCHPFVFRRGKRAARR